MQEFVNVAKVFVAAAVACLIVIGLAELKIMLDF